MRLNTEEEVKKWLRSIPLIKKELRMRIEFYKELKADFNDLDRYSTSVEYYTTKIDELEEKLNLLIEDRDRIFSLLEDDERLILTAKYIKLIKWDFIELHTYYSRRQAIRIHNAAIGKLVGQEVEAIIKNL